MTRRTAEERHRIEQGVSTELMDVLVALHHPTRRWLAELLWVEGPATVGRLAARTGLAVGSVSHHLKPLHQQGFIEPAPELARDTRESWWRTTPRNLSWSVEDFEPDSLGRRVAAAPSSGSPWLTVVGGPPPALALVVAGTCVRANRRS